MALDQPSWQERVCAALQSPPSHLWHVTTPKKLARYKATGAILPPVRGFDTREAALAWATKSKRTVILWIKVESVQALPDHHQTEGLAWWTPKPVAHWDVSDWLEPAGIK